ncbi:hypothetical protein, partial [Comamonas odontotermitis]|uniref:hypothetical protein n=1 Tax=Comamonas odontotermitis TaxID=379895 RepID=UPI001C86DC9B
PSWARPKRWPWHNYVWGLGRLSLKPIYATKPIYAQKSWKGVPFSGKANALEEEEFEKNYLPNSRSQFLLIAAIDPIDKT